MTIQSLKASDDTVCAGSLTVVEGEVPPLGALLAYFLELSKPVDFEKSMLYLVIGDRVSTLFTGSGCPLLTIWIFTCNHKPWVDRGF